VLAAVDRAILGHVAEHLDAEPAVEIADDPLLPRAADDLGGQPAGGAVSSARLVATGAS
jgi:hypothetical protein